jgi:NAD(P)-dependent dehydrogenase (short-subunit alcohol dehydrogenase family)
MIKFDFSGRKVLVTGGSRGIGLGVAEGFLKSGAEVTILASGSETTDVASELSEKYGRSVVVGWSELMYWSIMPDWN